MKNILIISGGIEAIPGIIKAKEMGLNVVVSDGNPNAPGFNYSDDKIIASTYDHKETYRKVKNYHTLKKNIDGVICIASDVPYTVAYVAEKLQLPGIPLKSANLAIDKILMKDSLSRSGVLVPDYHEIKSFAEFNNIINTWDYPLIIKPVDSRGARGVLRLVPGVDLDWAWNYSLKNSPSGRVMIERYLDGVQLSTESIIVKSKCYTCGYSDRNYEYLDRYAPHIIENGSDMPTIFSKHVKKRIDETIKMGAESLGIKNGIIKGDIVISDNEVKVIELATRLSGGYFSTNMIPSSTGIDLIKEAIKISLGEKIRHKDLLPKHNKYISQRYIFPNAGVIKKIKGIKKLKNNSSLKFFNIHAKVGQEIGKITSHPSRAGMVIAEGTSRKDAVNQCKKAINDIGFDYQ
ncbi:MAG: hypothetical protein CL881_07915 [Dehalococcoidia bacterium]|nr:hypothetical protein [Dehalococcoidia bacterium]